MNPQIERLQALVAQLIARLEHEKIGRASCRERV